MTNVRRQALMRNIVGGKDSIYRTFHYVVTCTSAWLKVEASSTLFIVKQTRSLNVSSDLFDIGSRLSVLVEKKKIYKYVHTVFSVL